MQPGTQVLSMREAVFIVSPKMENLGSLVPTSPETHGPVWIPIRISTGWPLCGMSTCAAQDSVSAGHTIR
jgi:hypothetical protein